MLQLILFKESMLTRPLSDLNVDIEFLKLAQTLAYQLGNYNNVLSRFCEGFCDSNLRAKSLYRSISELSTLLKEYKSDISVGLTRHKLYENL